MSKGKGKEIATKPDWKEQLAMLDQELGWDEQAGYDWADICGEEDQESAEQDHVADSLADQYAGPGATMTEEEYAACYEAQKYFDDCKDEAYYETSNDQEEDEMMSEAMQRSIWEAAVEASRSSVPCEDFNTDELYDDDYPTQSYATQQQQQQKQQQQQQQQQYHQQQEEEGLYEEGEYQEQELLQPNNMLAAYTYHRLGTDICYEHPYDHAEEYHAQAAGGTGLIKDPCVLLPYPQEDAPGTEGADKPMLMVTTPEGETLFAHDLEEYPEPPAAGWGRAAAQGGYTVPYEDEDAADI